MQKLVFSLAFLAITAFGACSPDAPKASSNAAVRFIQMFAPTADCTDIANIQDGTQSAFCKAGDQIFWIDVSPYEPPKVVKVWEAPHTPPAPVATPKGPGNP